MRDTPDATPLQHLQQRLDETRRIIVQPGEQVRPVELDQTLQGRISWIDAIGQQQMARARRSRLQCEVQRIEAAIRRIECGTFGQCCRRGEDVEPARLAADPAAPFCLSCADAAANPGTR